MVDDRFATKLNREEFQIDKESYEFKLRNPVAAKDPGSSGNYLKGKSNRYDDDSEDDNLRDTYKL